MRDFCLATISRCFLLLSSERLLSGHSGLLLLNSDRFLPGYNFSMLIAIEQWEIFVWLQSLGAYCYWIWEIFVWLQWEIFVWLQWFSAFEQWEIFVWLQSLGAYCYWAVIYFCLATVSRCLLLLSSERFLSGYYFSVLITIEHLEIFVRRQGIVIRVLGPVPRP